ncbi:hypothetical protein [Aliirhizobium smilacinae]|uniref:Uncharacterized protein n=1 Tax=Aliirhizobium smilacinae TaxID=1395944 RepID=A0A5C4XPC2_9HYPH|nr:hypothetical protein [Rhizobium smilacinae]TNM65282.1 hypothetical protein FHP24_03100 [Rhizobium smilacinae]
MIIPQQRSSDPLSAVDQALAWHEGDARATIETLMKDCDYLRGQLLLARGCISRGLTRGWLPNTDRDDV